MADPITITVVVETAVGVPIPGAHVELVVRRGAEWRVAQIGQLAPLTASLPDGFIQVEITASAPAYVDERLELTYWSGEHRWESTNPSVGVTEAGALTTVHLPLGRIRLAPIVMLPDDLLVDPTFLPGAVLATERGYRTVDTLLPLDEKVRVLSSTAIGNPNSLGWDRFRWGERQVNLADRGNWLILEYGDVSGRLDALRHLIGVWAPHSFVGARPPLVVQVTPNTRPPFYPADRRPFTGAYPYGCVALGAAVDKDTKKARLRDARQPFVELPANRCFGQYKVVYQLYAARPDIFEGPNGPILITLSPALLPSGPMRDPFQHPDGMGRLIAEVLRFLYANKLTLPMSTGGRSLRFRGREVLLGNSTRPISAPLGMPRSTITTIVTHSAGVVPVLELARQLARPKFPADFPEALWGGRNSYCDENWTNLWVIDGVATPGGIGIPDVGKPAAQVWSGWLRREGRRMALVYTPSGSSGAVAPELVVRTKGATTGASGAIAEAANQRVRWLHMSYTYLRADSSQNPPSVRPSFGALTDNAEQSHNKVYEFGVGYAAAR
jgi:hypothetical protein